MISVIELKKYVAGIGIFGIIVGKFCYEKKSCPIILLEVDESLEIGFYCTILPFNLAVHLQVKAGRKFPLDAKEIT